MFRGKGFDVCMLLSHGPEKKMLSDKWKLRERERLIASGKGNRVKCYQYVILDIECAVIRMFVSSSNSHVEILTPEMIVCGGGDFGRCLGHESGAFINGISILTRESPQILSPFHH